MNGPERGDILAAGENSDINWFYFSQINGYRWNNDVFFLYFNEIATSDRSVRNISPLTVATCAYFAEKAEVSFLTVVIALIWAK
ncbi:hypothetical protein [Paenibacillus sp. TH7-28]